MDAGISNYSSFLPAFYRWLFQLESNPTPRWTLHATGLDRTACNHLCRQLNVCRDDGQTRWLSFGAEEILSIANDPASRDLLGVSDEAENRATRPEGLRRIIRVIASRGDAVIHDPAAAEALRDKPRVLHLGVDRGSSCISLRTDSGSAPGEQSMPILLANLASEWLDAQTSVEGFAHSQAIGAEQLKAPTPNILAFKQHRP